MQLPQLLKKFRLTLPQLQAILDRHLEAPNLRLQRREVPAEWEAILIQELGSLDDAEPSALTVGDALMSHDIEALAKPLDAEKAVIERNRVEHPTDKDVRTPLPRLLNFKGLSKPASNQPDDLPVATGSYIPKKSGEGERQVKRHRHEVSSSSPPESELQLGQLTDVIDGRYGKIRKIDTIVKLHLPGPAVAKVFPAPNTWLLFAEQQDAKNPALQVVYWARPLGYDLDLLRRLLQPSEEYLLLTLLGSKLEADCQAVVAAELLARQNPITDAASLADTVRVLDLVLQKVPAIGQETVEGLVAAAAPEFAWQLWLRYHSPLAGWPEVAARLVKLLGATPEIVGRWWPEAQNVGIAGLYQAYVGAADSATLADAWQRLKTVLGTAQATVYNEMLRLWLEGIGEVDDVVAYQLYRAIVRTVNGDKAALELELNGHLTESALLAFWLTGAKSPFPREAALARFATLAIAEQDRVAAQFSDDELATVLRLVTAEHADITRQRARQLLDQRIIKTFAALGLDLESDRETIREIAWGCPGDWQTGKEPAAVAAALQALTERLAGAPCLVVGHNVQNFDGPVLAAHGVVINRALLWDTLAVEMALSPELHTYALQTAHTAAADAELALRLFVNQVLRVGQASETHWTALRLLFAPAVQVVLVEIRAQFPLGWLGTEALAMEMRASLRPQPKPSALRQQTQEWLASAPAGALLVAPREVWAELLLRSRVRFWADNTTALDYRELQPEHVLRLVEAHPTEQVMVRQFFELCQRAGWPALAANMAPALQARLRNLGIDLAQCLVPITTNADKWASGKTWCLTVEQLRDAYAGLQGITVALAVIEPDLITLHNKRELRQLAADELRANPATNTEWMKFSGGQSFIGLTEQQARQLGAEPPAGYDRFWLEKHQYGQYRLWASFGWEKLMQTLAGTKRPVTYLSGTARPFPASQLRNASPPTLRLQQQLGVVPLNPETIYRSRYWLLQAALIAGLAGRGYEPAPLVLLVQRPEEVARLESYFGAGGLGFYIPNGKAQLGRRLELLHQSQQERRLLVAAVEQAAAILEANYLGPLRVVLESFNLLENFYLAQSSALFETARRAMDEQTPAAADGDDAPATTAENSDDESPDDEQDDANRDVLERNLLFLLELQRPVVQRLQALVADNDSQSQLWLLDPRLADFAGLAQSWSFGREVVEVPWQQRSDYNAAAEQADVALGGVRPDTGFDLNLDAARDLLRQVFLRDETDPAQVKYYEWRPNQVPCLNDILPAQTDLVVTLATGGGKSVLFQAPALYRSSYTNRLSIVVTPLRALMADQVSKIWELGFYSSVEYINSDKQDELRQIYRRLAGGEIQLLFITPERFRSNGFRKAFDQRFALDGGLEYAVFDEAHCISQWGHEFRPDYLHSARQVQQMRQEAHRDFGRYFPVLLFSATVTEKILAHFTQLFPADEATR